MHIFGSPVSINKFCEAAFSISDGVCLHSVQLFRFICDTVFQAREISWPMCLKVKGKFHPVACNEVIEGSRSIALLFL